MVRSRASCARAGPSFWAEPEGRRPPRAHRVSKDPLEVDRSHQPPEGTDETHLVEDGLPLVDRASTPLGIETIVVPRARQPPQSREIEDRAWRHPAFFAPPVNILFRPEEQHGRSREP